MLFLQFAECSFNPFRHRLFPKHSHSRKRESLLRKRRLGEVLDAAVRPLCGWRGLADTRSIAAGCWPRAVAVALKRSGAASTCSWASCWVHHLQGLQNEARGAKGCARTRELRCGLNLRPELAELSRLSSLVAEGLPDSVGGCGGLYQAPRAHFSLRGGCTAHGASMCSRVVCMLSIAW